jgi:hypothetical protein
VMLTDGFIFKSCTFLALDSFCIIAISSAKLIKFIQFIDSVKSNQLRTFSCSYYHLISLPSIDESSDHNKSVPVATEKRC